MQNLSQQKHRSKSQSHIHSFYWTRRLTRTVCSLRPHFHAVLSVQASVFLWLCRMALWAPSGTYSADSEATRSKRNCEVVKGSRAFQEEVFLVIFFYFLTFILHAEEVLPWKHLEASGLSLIVLGSLCKIFKKKQLHFLSKWSWKCVDFVCIELFSLTFLALITACALNPRNNRP